MLSSAQLKKITSEARPIIERQLDDAAKLAGMRDVVAAAGGDWSQLKALIKAQIKDENDESGDGKHVRKILDKAEYATAYADMLGLSGFASMNEENFFEDVPHDADGVVIEDEEIGLKPPASKAEQAVSAAEEINEPAPALAEPVAADSGGGAGITSVATQSGATQPVDRSGADSPQALSLDPAPVAKSEPAALAPETAEPGDRSAVIPSAAPVTANDYSKPNPICQDPEDCGVHASWNHTCGSCLRRKATVEAGVALQ